MLTLPRHANILQMLVIVVEESIRPFFYRSAMASSQQPTSRRQRIDARKLAELLGGNHLKSV